MARRTSRAERRVLIERLLLEDVTRSDRSIARASGGSHALAGTVRRELEAAGRIERRPVRAEADVQAGGGRNGNLRRQPAGESGPATTHGVWSETTIAEARTRHLAALRERFPDADETLLALQSSRLARLEVLSDYIDRKGVSALIKRDATPREAALLIARLEQAIERCHARLEGDGQSAGVEAAQSIVDLAAEGRRVREARGTNDGEVVKR